MPEGEDLFGIYRNMVLYDFQKEFHSGFFVSYYRNFTIPSTARTLAARGEMKHRPMKRSYDTAIVIHEIITGGFDSDRGQAMVDLLRRVHTGVPGTSEDFMYVLMTLLVLPLRWIEKHGWHKLTPLEESAAVAFYAELGRRMGLADPAPETLAAAGRLLDEDEDRKLASSPEGKMLLESTVEAIKIRLPKPLQPMTVRVLALMMDKPQVTIALGLKRSPKLLQLIFNAVVRARALRARMQPLPTNPAFVPGKIAVSVYPSGYTLDQIGPPQS
ncbi:hypothetical protein GCM10027405_21240 [Arthrobacter alkaliphilus]|uniref:oxygenase MpaB family protein n=1 Tax=Arthrobacter alkaliphilus TaxID=369936 RepID=UPI001F42D3F4|nr:oxygenase MpaB family protein [Arthrobacter alkaliphilus]